MFLYNVVVVPTVLGVSVEFTYPENEPKVTGFAVIYSPEDQDFNGSLLSEKTSSDLHSLIQSPLTYYFFPTPTD